MKGIQRLIIKAQAQKGGGRVLRHIIVCEEPGSKERALPLLRPKPEDAHTWYMIQPYYNDHGKITTEGIYKPTKKEARDELERLEREFPKGPDYYVLYMSNEMVMYFKEKCEAGEDEDHIEFPAAMIRRAEHMLDERKK